MSIGILIDINNILTKLFKITKIYIKIVESKEEIRRKMGKIKCHLSRILGERRISQLELARISGLSTYTINKYYHENWKGIDEATLVKFCRALKVQVGDLFEYVDNRDDTGHRASANG